jgi:hypothetical protein
MALRIECPLHLDSPLVGTYRGQSDMEAVQAEKTSSRGSDASAALHFSSTRPRRQ